MWKYIAGLFVGVSLAAGARQHNRNRPPARPIYPDDHWDFSTKLTTENFNSFITENVDLGKTVFVRTIASEG